MKTLILLALAISCLQPRENVCRQDSRLCDDENHTGDNPPNNKPFIGERPIFIEDPYSPPDNTNTTSNTDTGDNTDDDSSNTDTEPNTDGGGVITVNQLTADTKLSAITIAGSCTQAGCLHAERGKKFKLWCEFWSSCLSRFKPEIKTSTSAQGISATPLCGHSALKVADLSRSTKLKCFFDNDVLMNLAKKQSNLNITADVITGKYICVSSSRQGDDLYVSTRAGLCAQDKTAMQLEFKW